MENKKLEEYQVVTKFGPDDLYLLHMLSNRVKNISIEEDFVLFDFGAGCFVEREVGVSKFKIPIYESVLASFVIESIASEKHGAISLRDSGAVECLIEEERDALGDLKNVRLVNGRRKGPTFMSVGFEYRHCNIEINATELFEAYIEAAQVGLAEKLAKQDQKD